MPLTNAEIYFRADEADALPTRVSPSDPLPVEVTGGRIAASPETSVIYNDGVPITPAFAVVSGATSGDNTVVAAGAKKIRVFALNIVCAGAVAVRFESGAGGTALTGVMSFAANGGYVLPFNPAGWFETSAGQLLNMELGGAVQVSGSLTYGLV